MSHQNGLSNNATETTGFTEPDDGDDRIQKESENVAHARMVSNRTSSRIQDARGIRLPHVAVSANFFSLLGVSPSIGRDFLPEDNRPGSERVVILSAGLWRS